MLDSMRQHRRNQLYKVLVYLIFAALIIVFAISFGPGSWGRKPRGGMATAAHAATVNGNIITAQELESEYASYAERYRKVYGRNIPDSQVSSVRRQRLDMLVNEELIAEHAKAAGIAVSDKELRDTITKISAFHVDGHFDPSRYRRYLSNLLGTSPAKFEAGLRKRMLVQKMVFALGQDVNVSPAAVKQRYIDTHDKLKLAYVRLSPVDFESGITPPTDAQVKKVLATRMDEVKAYFAKNKFRYDRPKRVKARHVLIKVAKDASDAVKAAAKKKAEMVLQKARSGTDFATLAKKYSDDPGSKNKGGELGWFGPGTMVKPFQDAAFALKKGEIAPKVVRSPFGYHVIQVEDVQPAVHETLDQVKTEIARSLLTEDAAKVIAKKKAESILAEVKAGKTLAEVVPPAEKPKGAKGAAPPKRADGLVSTTTGLESIRGGYIPGIGRDAKVAHELRALTGTQPVLPQVAFVGGSYYVVQVLVHQRPDMKKFAASKDTLLTQMKTQREQEIQQAWVDSLRDKADIQINRAVVDKS